MNDNKTPTMREIHDLLESIGKPGEKQDEKRKAVEDLFAERGASHIGIQGFSVLDDISSYPEY